MRTRSAAVPGAELLHDARPMHLDGARAEVTGGHGIGDCSFCNSAGSGILAAGTAHPASDGQPRQTVVTCAKTSANSRKGAADRSGNAMLLQGWIVIAVALGYIGLLFVVASYGDRTRELGRERPLAAC